MPPDASTLVFICGLHRSGTSLLFELLREHRQLSSFRDTGVSHDEGQHLQSVYPPARAFGGPGKFGLNPASHLTESSPLVTDANRAKLLREWGAHWDARKPFLLEKSPPNVVRTRFLQAMFPESRFVIIRRHPVPVSLATQKWSRTSLYSLFKHWVTCHEIWEADRPFVRRFREVSYERLVEAPLETVSELCAFLGADAPARMRGVVDPSVNQRYLVAWASLKRRLHLWPYVAFIERSFERRIGHWGYSFSAASRTEGASEPRRPSAAAPTG